MANAPDSAQQSGPDCIRLAASTQIGRTCQRSSVVLLRTVLWQELEMTRDTLLFYAVVSLTITIKCQFGGMSRPYRGAVEMRRLREELIHAAMTLGGMSA